MHSNRLWTIGAVLFATTLYLMLLPTGATVWQGNGAPSAEPVPAYHTQSPTGELPQTMDPEEFDHPVIKNAYALAAKVKKVLYQEPCYCHCDKGQGHASLLDCFTSKHGSMCNVCMAEAIYSYEQTQKRKTPAQIREAIIQGEWQHIDGSKYQSYPAKP
jgi:hypothetical protein